MNPFAKIEDACAQLVERTFARIFPNAVAPEQIARKLVATMQSENADTYLVRLNPSDVAALGERRGKLEAEWGDLLTRTASSVELSLKREARVVVHADDSVVSGTVAIDAILDDEEVASTRGYGLRVLRGLPLHAMWSIGEGLSLGRGQENDVDLVDARVSRRHARLVRSADGVIIEDLGSTNGTLVNGVKISGPTRITPGDVVSVGDTELRVEIADG